MPDWNTILIIAAGFFVIATLYSSVGFGGGSSYLALMALFVTDFHAIKTIALLCNLVVVTNGSYLFYKRGFFDWKKFIPLVICSVPAAFFGAMMRLTQHSFFIALGCVLILAGILLLVQIYLRPSAGPGKSFPSWMNLVLGTAIGFLSGMVGIGGGILLSPILNLLQWDNAKKIAALASFFILVNSISGLLGQLAGGTLQFNSTLFLPLLVAVFIGGQLGTRLSLNLIKASVVKGLTGVLVAYIGIKLILQYTKGINI
ncbi:MAG TPA: sulfite exporter TauE/SafE family protein [Chitinophagaceae bacterium]|nr:sulfite exporter TauE/SafE family protein [Chitinophagaceae bacterium]